MSKAPWTDGDRHPSADMLLLNLEGELDPKEAGGIEEHLKHCWSCRSRSERMQRSICAFVEHRDADVLPNLPTSPSEGAVFRARLHRIAADLKILTSVGHFLSAVGRRRFAAIRNTWEYHRPRLLSAMVATAMAVLLITLPVIDPPAITAAVLLERARASQESALDQSLRAGIYERIAIRHGRRTVTRELYYGLPKPEQLQSEPASDLQELFHKAGFDWEDPLSVQSFTNWRDALRRKEDMVRAADKHVTLTTRAVDGSSVAEASLTVRQTDWHPVAETIELRGVEGPLEIAELAFEVRNPNAMLEARVTETHHKAAIGQLQPPEPSEDELQIAEAELREALHKAGADVREAPQIWRNGNQVLFSVLTDRAERRQEIYQSVAGIPHVAVSQMPSASGITRQARRPEQLRTVNPPLGKALEDYFGRIDLSNQYLDRVQDTYLTLIAEASALDRLGARYPQPALEALPSEARDSVLRTAAGQIANLERGVGDYVAVVSPVVNEMLRQTGLVNDATAEAQAACAGWQPGATLLVERLRGFQDPFSRLFIRHEVEEDVIPSASDLLGVAANRQAALIDAIHSLCLPE